MGTDVVPLQPEAGVVPVRLAHTATGYQLLRNGKPYFIKGASGVQRFDLIRQCGGNSVRIYSPNYADVLLDDAQRQGLTVMFGLWMRPPYEKFDYYDPQAVRAQQEEICRQVMRYKNHPALLMWNLGNELDNNNGDFKVYQVVNETVRMIHQLDPNHPVTTAVTDGIYAIPAIANLCPDLDVLTVNVFDKLAIEPARLAKAGWSRAFVIGEFGVRGWWESPLTSWNAPIEPTNAEKVATIERGYRAAIVGAPERCLGGYVLYWGNRFEQTAMWLSLLSPAGEKTPQLDMMHYLWTNQRFPNLAPQVGTVRLAGRQPLDDVALLPDTDYPATVSATDAEGDTLRVQWAVTRDADELHTLPQNRTAPETIPGAIRRATGLRAVVHTPRERGAYRLLVSVRDGHGSLGTDSFPFFVGKPDHPELGIHAR
ncbi:hypothetical protein GCM10027345_20350 [Hymenobacter daeguensis]